MAKYLVNKIFPTKVKKDIYVCYIQDAVVNGYDIMDIVGKPFSQINMMELWSRCLFQRCVYVESESKLMAQTGFDYKSADIAELCDFILENQTLFRIKTYGTTLYTNKVIDFIPKYLEIMDILRSGEVYKGLKMN